MMLPSGKIVRNGHLWISVVSLIVCLSSIFYDQSTRKSPNFSVESASENITEISATWVSLEEYLVRSVLRQTPTFSLTKVELTPSQDDLTVQTIPDPFPKLIELSISSSESAGSLVLCIEHSSGRRECTDYSFSPKDFSCADTSCTASSRIDIPVIESYGPSLFALSSFGISLVVLIMQLVSMKNEFRSARLILNAIIKLRQINFFLDRHINEKSLITFDWKSVALLVLISAMFISSLALKLHSSSVYYWNNFLGPSHEQEGLLLGSPRGIRSDEWLVKTTAEFSQSSSGYPEHNSALGEEESPIALNVPSKELYMILRPQMWGSFLFDGERAFVFNWNVVSMGMFAGVFLLLMFFTRSNFFLSLIGTLLIFFSSYVQWWFSSVAGIIFTFSFSSISMMYLMLSRNKSVIIASSIALIFSIINFVLFLYPPFQLPLGYVLLFSTIGIFIEHRGEVLDKTCRGIRIVAIITAIIGIGLILFYIYRDIKPTIDAILSTAYPGKRTDSGGAMSLYSVFSGFITFFMTETHFPNSFGNVAEASNFILIFPLVSPLFFISRGKPFSIRPSQIMVFLCLLLFTAWALVPFDPTISRLLFLSSVSGNRILFAIGISDLLLSMSLGSDIIRSRRHYSRTTILFITLFAFSLVFLVGFFSLTQESGFITLPIVTIISLFFALVMYSIASRHYLLCSCLILGALIPNIAINPISSGANVFEDDELATLFDDHSDARWAVFGDSRYAGLIRAYGADVLNGVKYPPDVETLSLFDSDNQNSFIYNRYAHISLVESNEEAVLFSLTTQDAYSVQVNPCDTRFSQAHVGYVLFTYEPKNPLSCADEIFSRTDGDIFLRAYKLHWNEDLVQ